MSEKPELQIIDEAGEITPEMWNLLVEDMVVRGSAHFMRRGDGSVTIIPHHEFYPPTPAATPEAASPPSE